MSTTVLVTGAADSLAATSSKSPSSAGHNVRALVHYNGRGDWGHLAPAAGLEAQVGDVTDPFLVRDLLAGCDVVFHLAALIGIPYSYHAPASYVATNVHGTLNILEACRHAKTRGAVHPVTSTSEVYGTAQFVPITEDHPLQGQSPYSASKIAADHVWLSFCHSFGVPVAVIRPFNTYGPRQSGRAVIPTIITQIASGQKRLARRPRADA